jgi:hypothetical protein
LWRRPRGSVACLVGAGEVDGDELALGGLEVGLEPEEGALVGDVLVLRLPVVDQLHHLRHTNPHIVSISISIIIIAIAFATSDVVGNAYGEPVVTAGGGLEASQVVVVELVHGRCALVVGEQQVPAVIYERMKAVAVFERESLSRSVVLREEQAWGREPVTSTPKMRVGSSGVSKMRGSSSWLVPSLW